MKSAFALAALALLLAGCGATHINPGTYIAVPNTAQITPPAGLGTVVVGVAVRNAKESFLGTPRPVWAGWIAYDPQTQRRVGNTMLLLGEDCFGSTSLNPGVVEAKKSIACSDLQYRIIHIEPGTYALGWVYHDFMMKPFARFRSASVDYNRNTSFLSGYGFSEDAIVPAGSYIFSVAAGEVVYIGDVRFDFEGENSIRAAIGEGRPEEARAYLAPTGLADRMIARAATILKTAPPSSGDSPAAASP